MSALTRLSSSYRALSVRSRPFSHPSSRGSTPPLRPPRFFPHPQPQCHPSRQLRTTPSPASPPPHPDGMSRWPGLSSARLQLRALDWAGTAVFASSGAAAAATSGMDALGACIVGTVTAVGGGTIRDAVMLRKIPFWTEEVEYLYLSLAAAGATFCLWPRDPVDGTPKDHPSLQWADAFGVGAFATIGAQNGIRAGMPALVVIMCGVSTATFGGAVRDVTLNRPIRILHSHAELYATTAAAGASAYMLARSAGAPPWARIWAGVCTSIAARYVSWSYGVRLPTWETGAFAVRPPMKLDSPLAALEPGTATEVCERSLLGAAGGGAEGGEKK